MKLHTLILIFNIFVIGQDGNGFINRLELAVVMQNLGEQLEQEEIQVIDLVIIVI